MLFGGSDMDQLSVFEFFRNLNLYEITLINIDGILTILSILKSCFSNHEAQVLRRICIPLRKLLELVRAMTK